MPHAATAALPPLRVSDLEREHIAGLLREYFLAGRLTIAEFEERLEEAWCACFVDDLWEALRELPARDRAPAPLTSQLTHAPPAPYLPPARAAPRRASLQLLPRPLRAGMAWLRWSWAA